MSEHKGEQEEKERATVPNGGICYAFGIVFPLIYLLSVRRAKQDPFLRFNSFQCLVIFAFLSFFHFVSFPAGWPEQASEIGFLICFLAWLVSMIQAGRRVWFYLPVIGKAAKRLAEL